MSPAVILEFPSNLGLKEPTPGHEPGVKKLPAWLKEHGFHEKINPVAVTTLEPPSYSTHIDPVSRVRNADAIIDYARQQANVMEEALHSGLFPVVLGGDCSILIGNALALKKAGSFGLFHIDGHHDFMLPSLSQTAGAAGMDTAIVTGHGHEKLTNIHGLAPYFKEQYVWCVGSREYDKEYVQPILETDITYADLEELRRQGGRYYVNSFLRTIKAKKLDGFFIHLDVDVLDDALMPAVDSRTDGGLSYEELAEILTPLLQSPQATGLEITILDPELDQNGRYTKKFVKHFCDVFNSVNGR